MPIIQLQPPQAYESLRSTPGAIYLDVRTEGEFAQGHPAGALNVPVVFIKGPGQMQPNPDFVAVVEEVIAKDIPLIVGCMAGGRSQRACEILEGVGYTNLTNVQGGYGGARDASGEVVTPGWRDAGLPISNELGDAAYQSLRAKAGL